MTMRVILTSELVRVLGSKLAASFLNVEASALGLPVNLFSVVPWEILASNGGQMDYSVFYEALRQEVVNEDEFNKTLDELEPAIAWIGSNAMLMAGLSLASDIESGHIESRATVERVVWWARTLGVSWHDLWQELSTLNDSEFVRALQSDLV